MDHSLHHLLVVDAIFPRLQLEPLTWDAPHNATENDLVVLNN